MDTVAPIKEEHFYGFNVSKRDFPVGKLDSSVGKFDFSVGKLEFSIGKLDLYVAAGGFHPRRVLPVVLDVGTNNQRLINDKRYLGLKQPRLDGMLTL